MPQNTPAQPEERPQQETAQQAPKSNPAPSDHFSLSTNFKLIPPLENAQRSRYPMVLSASTSEDEVFALPSISGVPQHLLVGTQENHVPLNQRPRLQQVDILENYLHACGHEPADAGACAGVSAAQLQGDCPG